MNAMRVKMGRSPGDACTYLASAVLLFGLAGMMCASAAGDGVPWDTPKRGIAALEPDYVPPAWSELTLAGKTVSAAWKRVTFGELGLPASLTVRETKLLASPLAIEAEVNGELAAFAPENQEFKKLGKGRVVGVTRLSSRHLNLTVSTQVEYDFAIVVNITLDPKEPAVLNRFVIHCAIPPACGEFCHYMDEDPPKLQAGIFGQRRLKFLQLAPEDSVSRGFCPVFWLGNMKAGISWTFESARNWNTSQDKAITFDRKTGSFNIHLVTKPCPLDKALSYVFIIQPTPLKDMPRNWRTWNFGCRQLPQGPVPEQEQVRKYVIYWNALYRLGPDVNNSWVRNPEALRKVVKQDHAAGFLVLPYICPCLVTYEEFFTKDGKAYHFEDPGRTQCVDEWAVSIDGTPGARPGYYKRNPPPAGAVLLKTIEERNRLWNGEYAKEAKYNPAFVGPTPGFSDFMAWYVERFIHDYDADGLYVDGIGPRADFRIVDEDPARAFRDFDGNIRPTYAFRAMRDFTKRIRYVVDERKQPNGFMLGHTSGTRLAPLMGFYDIMLIGENFFYGYQEPELRDASPTGDYYYAHIFGDIDRLRPEFFWQPWGVPNFFLPELRGKDGKIFPNPRKGTRTMLSYLLHFDMLLWPNWSDTAEVYKWWAIKDKFGMADTATESVEFVPYWENRLVTAANPAVKVSYYRKVLQPDPYIHNEAKENVLLIVSNLQFDEAEIRLSLPEKLQKCTITDVDAQRPLDRSKPDTVQFKLAPYDFAILHVTSAQP